MSRSNRVSLILLCCLVAITGVVRAGTSPDAQQWIDKMHQAYGKGPFSVDYTAEMNTDTMGQPLSVSLEGEAIHKDSTHMNTKLVLTMKMGEDSVDVKVLQISDGSTMWMEMDNPLAGGKQVMKVRLDHAGHIAAVGGGVLSGSVDPISQIPDIVEKFDFQVVGKADGRVTLNATMTEKAQAELADALPLAEAMKEMTVVLNEKTGTPVEMRIGGASPFLTVRIASFEYLETVDPALFVYTPPAGVPVRDLDEEIKPEPAAAGG